MKAKELEKELEALRKRVEDLEKQKNPVWVGPFYVPVPYPVPVYPQPYWPQPWYRPYWYQQGTLQGTQFPGQILMGQGATTAQGLKIGQGVTVTMRQQ